jgi:hypothetical protein
MVAIYMRGFFKLFSGVVCMCLLMLIFSVVHAEQSDDIENPEN